MQSSNESTDATASASPENETRSAWREIVDVLKGHPRDYTTGSLRRSILLLAIPMVLEMALESLFAVVDVYFVARIGDDAVATVGLTEAMLTIIYAIGIGVSMSATALVARRIGEKNVDGAVRAATQAIALGVVIGVAFGIPCFIWAEELLRFMGASENVIASGVGYTRILLSTNIVILLLFLNNAILRGAGDAVLAMRTLWISNGINILLDPCLIFGLGPFPEMGITGAAVATLIGRGTGVLFQFWMLRRGVGRVRLYGEAFAFVPKIMLELLRLSIGGVTQFLIATASWVALMRIVAPFGETVLAGYTIAIRVVMFALLPAWGLSNAAATLVGQNLGAKQPERAERAVWLTGLYTTAFMLFVTIAFTVSASSIAGLFTDSAETREAAASALRILASGYLFYAWGMVTIQAFNGAGDTMTPTRLSFVCFWLVQVPLAWVLATQTSLNERGVFWSVPIAESLLAVLAVIWFKRGRWKTTQIAADVH